MTTLALRSADPPTFFAPAVIISSGSENILTETCLSDHGFIPILCPNPFIFCPDGTILRVHRSPHDRRTFIHGHVITQNSHTFLGLGFEPHAGRPITLLLDTGAGIAVLCESEAGLICERTHARPIYVVGGRSIAPICGGTLAFRYKSSPSPFPIPFLDAYFGPRTASGLGTPTAALSLHFPLPAHPSVLAVRPSGGALWHSPTRVCETLNIWNPSDLARYPDVVRGVAPYATQTGADYGRASIFYRAAAARPGAASKRNAASAAAAIEEAPSAGEWWDMDISPPCPLDPESNCRTFFFFERTSAYPFLAFRPSKSAEDFTFSVDLLRDYMLAICPKVFLKRLCGDFDPSWVVAARPDDILNTHVRAHATFHGYTIVPAPAHSPELSRAEPHIRRLAAFAFANAVSANLN